MKNKRTVAKVSDKPTSSYRRTRSQAEVRVKPTQNIFKETSEIFKHFNVRGTSTYNHGSGPDSYFRKTLRNYDQDLGSILDNYRLFKLKKEESESGLTNSIRKALDHHHRHNSVRKPRSPLTVPSSDDSTSSIKTDNYYTSRLSPRGDYEDLIENYHRLRDKLLKATESEVFLDTLTSPIMADEEPTTAIEEPTTAIEEAVEEPTEEQPAVEGDGAGEAEAPPADEVEEVKEEAPADDIDIRESVSVIEENEPDNIGDTNVDPLAETEQMIKKASSEIDNIEREIKPESKDLEFEGSAQVIKEVESCERQCMEIYGILNELKKRVGELMNKETRSDAEDRELEEKQKMLNEKMHLLEEKTRRIEQLIGQTKSLNKEYDKEHTEDILPKVIICGLSDDRSPNLIVCDEKRKRKKPITMGDTYVQDMPGGMNTGVDSKWGQNVPTVDEIRPLRNYNPCLAPCGKVGLCDGTVGPNVPLPDMMAKDDFRQCVPNCVGRQSNFNEVRPPSGNHPCSAKCARDTANTPCPNVPQFAQKLNESYCMQDKLAQENANLENKRYQLQTDLLNKDGTVENLQRRICSLQADMRNVCKENTILCEKLDKIQTTPRNRGDTCPTKRMPCGKDKGICPAEVESRLNEYNETTQNLEKQLGDMENEVKTMQQEIMQVRQERLHLEQHRRMMCPQPAPAMPCNAPNTANRMASPATESQLRELKEQYKTIQDDYKGKMTEVAGLRADIEKQKKNAADAEEARKIADDRNKENEKFIKQFKMQNNKLMGTKEALVQQEQELSVAKQRLRETKDELDEVRALVEDQDQQLQDYRQKYLEAQQQVEEQRRQIDLMELENNRVAEQVNLEIQRVKNQFQEKLQELTPLPDILKATQLKLQEAQQMHMLAERNNEALVRELQSYRDKAADMINEMEKVRSNQELGANEKQSLQQRCDAFERRCVEYSDEVSHLQLELSQQEDLANEHEMRTQEKLHEVAQLQAEMDNLREESARQVSRTKDRCETVRRSMQSQVSDLERQLASSRAQARSAQKDRDDIRQKMQSQINNLNENFDDAQMRIRNLQGHVNFLKNSYTVFAANEATTQPAEIDACACCPGI